MLLTDEQYVVKWLSQYGALPRAQIIKMLQKPPQTAEKILRNLKRQMRIADVSGGYYIGLDPMCQPDQRMILAIWYCSGSLTRWSRWRIIRRSTRRSYFF